MQMADMQNKLSELEKSQSELMTENASLKDLCLYLSEQGEPLSLSEYVARAAAMSRDSGDGSSGSSQSVDKLVSGVHETEISPSLNPPQLPLRGMYFGSVIFCCMKQFVMVETV